MLSDIYIHSLDLQLKPTSLSHRVHPYNKLHSLVDRGLLSPQNFPDTLLILVLVHVGDEGWEEDYVVDRITPPLRNVPLLVSKPVNYYMVKGTWQTWLN